MNQRKNKPKNRTYGKNLIEAVKKRDQIAFESLKYMNEKTKGLSF